MKRALALLVLAAAACGAPPADDVASAPAAASPASGTFRDFVRDRGKFDEAGHPLNARVTDARAICKGRGRRLAASVEVVGSRDGAGEVCRGALAGGAQLGELTLAVHLRATPGAADARDVATVTVAAGATRVGAATLAPTGVRTAGQWQSLAVPFTHDAPGPLTVTLRTAGNGRLEVDYFELFPTTFSLAIGPGSGEVTTASELVFESARGADAVEVNANGSDVSDQLAALLASGKARADVTSFRRAIHVPALGLVAGVPGTVELLVRSDGHAARVELRRAPPPCRFEGDPKGRKVLVTGFQAFPADATHDNVSGVAVMALRPSALAGVQVMRLVLPVEYEGAAREVTSAIARCRPDAVVSFGQGNDAIALERVAYNLRDTSEVPGGVPDNRGAIAVAAPIAPGGASQRPSRLPLDRIAAALAAAGEAPVYSTDPDRYVCNDVFFNEVGAVGATTRAAGFVHLPYTTDFSDAVRARFGAVVETVVRAVARSL